MNKSTMERVNYGKGKKQTVSVDFSPKTPQMRTSVIIPKLDNTDLGGTSIFDTPEVELEMPPLRKPDALDKRTDYMRSMVMRRDLKQQIFKKNQAMHIKHQLIKKLINMAHAGGSTELISDNSKFVFDNYTGAPLLLKSSKEGKDTRNMNFKV